MNRPREAESLSSLSRFSSPGIDSGHSCTREMMRSLQMRRQRSLHCASLAPSGSRSVYACRALVGHRQMNARHASGRRGAP